MDNIHLRKKLAGFLRYVVSIVLLLSAAAKVYSSNETIVIIAEVIGTSYDTSETVVVLLMILETALALGILLIDNMIMYTFIVSVFTVFSIVSFLFLITGRATCGCFGDFALHPVWSFLKNSSLLSALVVLRPGKST